MVHLFKKNITLPEGYQIESTPESVAYSLPGDLGSYQFICKSNANKLQVSSDLIMNTSIISVQNYGDLKAFYKHIIDKHLEKVVLSKI